MSVKHKHTKSAREMVAVIGLGRFGAAVARALLQSGHDVLAVDSNAGLVQMFADEFPHVMQADTTDGDVLRQIGLADFTRVVVGIGSDIEASVVTTMGLTDLGIPQIWAKATNETHGRILERVGAHHVVYPEAQMGGRVAKLVTGKMIDYIEFDDDFSIIKTRVPAMLIGKRIDETDCIAQYGVSIIGVKPQSGPFRHVSGDIVIGTDDLLIVSGCNQKCESFANIG